MRSVTNSHLSFEEYKKLNINVDPWDNYLYYDSRFIFDFCFGNPNILSFDRFVHLKFIIFLYFNELLSNFKKSGKLIAEDLIRFLK